MKDYLIKLLPLTFLNYFKKIYSRNTAFLFIQNINWQPNMPNQKKLLFSYVFNHLFEDLENNICGTRGVESAIMISEFIKKGYCIDLIDCRNENEESIIRKKKYDLVFGFGKPFNLLNQPEVDTKRIMYLTEKHPQYSKKKEKERLDYYYSRYNKKVNYSRTGLFYKEEDFVNLDSIVYIGSPKDSDLIPCSIPKHSIAPTGLINKKYKLHQRQISASKTKFLWFGSLGAIHKGLDLLIDAFKLNPNYTLYIAGLGKIEEKNLPKYSNNKNIVNLGYVNVNSDRFLNIINDCSYVILPSCSEAMSTGVITCMNHGLIPIITEDVGFQFPNFGYELSDYKIETIIDTVMKCANLKTSVIKDQHEKAYNYSMQHFSAEQFQKSFAGIIRNF